MVSLTLHPLRDGKSHSIFTITVRLITACSTVQYSAVQCRLTNPRLVLLCMYVQQIGTRAHILLPVVTDFKYRTTAEMAKSDAIKTR